MQTGDNVRIGGFILQGSTPKTVLIRAVGPTLASSGVSGVLANPKLDLYSGSTVIDSNDDWQTASNAAAAASAWWRCLCSKRRVGERWRCPYRKHLHPSQSTSRRLHGTPHQTLASGSFFVSAGMVAHNLAAGSMNFGMDSVLMDFWCVRNLPKVAHCIHSAAPTWPDRA